MGGLTLHNLSINVASQISQLVSLGLYASNREIIFSGEQFQTVYVPALLGKVLSRETIQTRNISYIILLSQVPKWRGKIPMTEINGT